MLKSCLLHRFVKSAKIKEKKEALRDGTND